jgi:hypothetical protein
MSMLSFMGGFKHSLELTAEDLGHAAAHLAHQRNERWDGAEELAEQLDYHQRHRPYKRWVLPEHLQVEPDTGCEGVSDSCLACPLPQCLWDYSAQERIKVKREFLEAKL